MIKIMKNTTFHGKIPLVEYLPNDMTMRASVTAPRDCLMMVVSVLTYIVKLHFKFLGSVF